MTVTIDGSNGLTFPNNSTQAVGFYGFKNRIINGAMVIDQRNAGASSTAVSYTVDRWSYYAGGVTGKFTWGQNLNSVTAPSGFTNYLGFQSTSAYSMASTDRFGVYQAIEGFNTADLGWGTANAKTVTLSFWVYSSLTGTFGAFLENNAGNRLYGFTYSISSANTWTQISVTIAGDTTGTWLTNNSVGIQLNYSLGAGSAQLISTGWGSTAGFGITGQTNVVSTNNATFYITGVQLEVGTQATSFDYRPYGTELILCQRYYQSGGWGMRAAVDGSGYINGTVLLPVVMRASPSVSTAAWSGGNAGDVGGSPWPQPFGFLLYEPASSIQNTYTASAEL